MKHLLIFSLCLASTFLMAQDDLTQASILGMVSRNADQITSLAEAFSDDQYDWRPDEGVRSVGESLLHIAKVNYFILMKLGFELPEGVDMMAIDGITGKENIMEVVGNSFDFAKGKIPMVESAQLGDEVKLPFGDFTKLSSLLIVLEHSGEHKGQLIAYARSNGIVPPWSQ